MKSLPYVFLFMIGFHVYLFIQLFSEPITEQPLSLLVSLLSFSIASFVYLKKHHFSGQVITMALTVVMLSAGFITTFSISLIT